MTFSNDDPIFAAPGTRRLCVMRDGHAVVRDWKIPKPTVLVDTREQQPLDLVGRHPNWIGAQRSATLKSGDYTIEGMEALLTLERKSMVDAIQSVMIRREAFIRSCERLATFRWKAILIEATYEDMKTCYHDLGDDLQTEAHPNAVCGTSAILIMTFFILFLYRA